MKIRRSARPYPQHPQLRTGFVSLTCLEQGGGTREMSLLGLDLRLDPIDLALQIADIGLQFLDGETVEFPRRHGLFARFQIFGLHIGLLTLRAMPQATHISPSARIRKRHDRHSRCPAPDPIPTTSPGPSVGAQARSDLAL